MFSRIASHWSLGKIVLSRFLLSFFLSFLYYFRYHERAFKKSSEGLRSWHCGYNDPEKLCITASPLDAEPWCKYEDVVILEDNECLAY